MGHALSAGVGHAPARQAAFYANLPKGVCCTTVNKVCASGLKAITLATQALQLGQAEVVVAGGMESMSNVPYYMQNGTIPYGATALRDGIIYDALSDYSSKIALSQYAYLEAQRLAISQAELDTYYKISQLRALDAIESGVFVDEIVPVRIRREGKSFINCLIDEDVQKPLQNYNTSCALSTLNDGAAALVLTTLHKCKELKLEPLAKILGYQDIETDASNFAIAPAIAVERLLNRLNIDIENVKRFEVNDDVALLPLAFIRHLNVPAEIVNAEGGALALGHPIGMTGARMVTHLAHILKSEGDLGCAAISDGDCGASAILIEKIQTKDLYDSPYPVLTIYTKPDCTLCNEMVEELKEKFGSEYVLEKVDISEKHNAYWSSLYRNDIPVLFFNRQFLCMHRLDEDLLRRRMESCRQNP